MIRIIPIILGLAVVASIVICKFYATPTIFFLVLILSSFFYQVATNRAHNKLHNFSETLINISQFIIIAGVLGFLAAKITGFFLPGFN